MDNNFTKLKMILVFKKNDNVLKYNYTNGTVCWMNINISFIIYINYNVEHQKYGVRFKSIVNKNNIYLKARMYFILFWNNYF